MCRHHVRFPASAPDTSEVAGGLGLCILLFLIACECSYFQSLDIIFWCCVAPEDVCRDASAWRAEVQVPAFHVASCSENVNTAQRKNEEREKGTLKYAKVLTVFRSHN